MKVVVCIPARYESTRFPGKVLAQDTGKYLVQHTYEQACRAQRPAEVIVAADDQQVMDAVQGFGARAVLTSPDHQSGTDRIAGAVAEIEADIVVNLQGDEPEIDPAHIDQVAELLIENQTSKDSGHKAPMATLGAPLASPDMTRALFPMQDRMLRAAVALRLPCLRPGFFTLTPGSTWSATQPHAGCPTLRL